MIDADLLERVNAWIAGDPDPTTRAELRAVVDRGEEADLRERMAGPLEFGTAGLRGVLGAGESRMNRAVVLRTTDGLARYILEHVPHGAQAGVVIGYDGRRMSRVFAEDAANVLAAHGIVAHLFDDLVPTPVTAYGVTTLKAAAGIMVTASHNPPEYNGYKVYWGDGAQIIPPHDTGIAELIKGAKPAREIATMGLEEARQKGLLRVIGADVLGTYYDAITALSRDSKGRDLVTVVYTPMHGVGDVYARTALDRYGFKKVTSVPEQRKPDGEFPTVAFPNPEEKGALDLSFACARRENANLILANDPDADRLAVAIPDGAGGFRQLTGNEVGVLLAEYLLRKTPGGAERLVITSIVSSPMLGHMAKQLGVQYAEVLTGFKWIATTAMRHERESGQVFIFGYEEALGYTAGTVARDKDGVSAAALFAELTAVALAEGHTIAGELERLAKTFGVFVSAQHNITKKGVAGAGEIAAIMDQLRALPPAKIGSETVTAFRDLHAGTRTAGGVVEKLDLPPSNVLVFELENARVIARPSGTEPKIKFYFDVREEQREGEAFAVAKSRAEARLAALRSAFVELAG